MVGVDKMIYAVASGIVVVSSIITDHSNDAWAFGNRIMIKGDDGRYIMYNHLASRRVLQGQRVEEGDLIGVEGGTGNCVPAGASHLHIEIRDRQGAPFTALSIADYLGIPNVVGPHTMATGTTEMTAPASHAEIVRFKCNLEPQTMAYLKKYKYADDLFAKIAEKLK